MAQRYEFYVLVAFFLPLEHKIHILSPTANILYRFYMILAHILLKLIGNGFAFRFVVITLDVISVLMVE